MPASSSDGRASPGRPLLRVITAAGLIFYGCAKITGAQFRVLDSELDRPLREVSGFWLTWYYFGHFAAYKYFLAICEIASGVLLCSRQSSLLGALLACALLVNVVIIDLVFGVDAGGTMAAILLLVASTAIASDHRHVLRACLWPRVSDDDPRWLRPKGLVVAAALVAGGLGLNYWILNDNNREPTLIDGVWDVASGGGTVATVYFERERAHMCVLVSPTGEHLTRDFAFVPGDASLAIHERWLKPSSPLLYTGRLQGDGALVLRDERTGAQLTLTRRVGSR